MIQKSVQVTEEQNAWLKENHISFSALIRDHLDDKIAMHGQHIKNMETEEDTKPPSGSSSPATGEPDNESHTTL